MTADKEREHSYFQRVAEVPCTPEPGAAHLLSQGLGFPWSCQRRSAAPRALGQVPCWLRLGLSTDTRRDSGFTVSYLTDCRASWVTAWRVTSPHSQGNLARVLLAHPI